MQGSSGDIMKCIYTRTSGSYSSSDWAKASKYTDDTKANQVATDLANNYYTITETDNAITVAKGSIELSVSEKVETIYESIDNIEIGGRNLIRNSAFVNGIHCWSFAPNVSLDASRTFNGHASVKSSQSGLTHDEWRGCTNAYLPITNPITANQTYTLSCYYYVEDTSVFDSNIGLEVKGVKSSSTSGTQSHICSIGVSQADLVSNKWTRIVGTFTLTEEYSSSFVYAWVGKNGTAWFTDFKLEKGDKCTDWSAAPEDAEDSTGAVKDNLANNYYTKTQTDNAITVAKGSIELSVSESIESRIGNMQIGGRNLAQKTSSKYCDLISSFNGGTNDCKDVCEVLTDGLTVGDTVCVRLYYKYNNIVSASSQTANVRIQGSGDVTGWNDGAFYSSPRLYLSGSGEHEFKYSFTITAEHLRNAKWYINLRHDYVASGSVQWKKFKVERGEMYTDWTPAPEDVDDNLANNYYTKSETEGKINVATNNITTTVSQTYTTKNELGNTLSSYATKTEVNQTSNSILTTVSDTYATKNALGSLESRVNSAEQQITTDAIINKVNTSLNNGKSISTTSTTLNKNGFTIYNGAIYVKNKNGENVLWGDTNGNLQAKGKITTINNNGYLNLEGNKLQGYKSGMSVPMYSCGMWYPNNGSTLTGFVSVSNGNSLLGDNEGCLYMSGWNDSSNANKKAVLQYSRNQGSSTGTVEFYTNGGVSIVSRNTGGNSYGIWNSQEGYVYPYRGDEYLGGSTLPWTRAYIKEMYQGSVSYFSAPSSNYLLTNVNDDEIETYAVDNKPKPKDFVEFVENLEFGIYKKGEDNEEEIQTFAEKETNLNFMPIVDDISTFALDENPAKSLVIQTVTDRNGENPQQAINLMGYCTTLAITIQELIKENKELKNEIVEIKNRLNNLEK